MPYGIRFSLEKEYDSLVDAIFGNTHKNGALPVIGSIKVTKKACKKILSRS
jgi:hypothetical protein